MNTTTQSTGTASEVLSVPKNPVQFGSRGVQITSMDDLWRFAGYVTTSGLAPKGIQTREAIFVAIQMGAEVGLTPMSALQNIAVINGRPSIWGDAQLGVVRATGELESFTEWMEDANGKKLTRNPATWADGVCAVCRVKRRGYDAVEQSFSVSDAKAAKLWGKEGPWSQYPARMLKLRARSFALRDQFGDALRGLRSVEETMDNSDAIEVSSERVGAVEVKEPKLFSPPTSNVETAQPSQPTGDSLPGLEPAAETKKAPTIQDDLAHAVMSEGISFDRWQQWALATGQIEAELPGFDWLPATLAKKLLAAKSAMIKAIKESK